MTAKRTRRAWTDEDRARLAAAYAEPGATRPAIARRLGRTVKAIKHEAWRMKLILAASEPKPVPASRPVVDWHAHAAELRRRGIGEATVRAMLASVAR